MTVLFHAQAIIIYANSINHPPTGGENKTKIKMKKKLKNKKYLRIEPETFKGWIREIMKSEGMRYAPPQVVAEEIEKRYGGLATSHLYRIRAMRLNMQDFLPREENGE